MRNTAIIVVLLCCLISATTASAQPQVEGIRFGWEEEIVHVADLPPLQQAVLKVQTDLDLAVGFAYRRAFLFHGAFSFWHWRGRYVLYSGGNVFEIRSAELEAMLGKDSHASLRPPWAYRVPAGLLTVVFLVILGLTVNYFMPSTYSRVQRLLQNTKYAQAVEVYEAALPGSNEESTAVLRRLALTTASDYLVNEKSVPRPEAESNLKMIVSQREEMTSKALRQLALAHEEAGEWDDALDRYEAAAELRELWDPKDYAFLQKCIHRVEQKQATVDQISVNNRPRIRFDP